MAVKLDGKLVSGKLESRIRECVVDLQERFDVVPTLAIISSEGEESSNLYIRNKMRKAAQLGMRSELFNLGNTAKLEDLISLVTRLNQDDSYHGIFVELPLPKHINRDEEYVLFDSISPRKDVDALSGENTLAIYRGQEGLFIPCTARGVFTLLEAYGKGNVEGLRDVVIGRKDTTAKALHILMGGRLKNATSTIISTWGHRYTRNLEEETLRADIIISATGKPRLIKEKVVKPGAIVIDIGISYIQDGDRRIIVGDVDFAAVKEKASYITPVPGGVGPMTVISLMQNLVDAARYSRGLDRVNKDFYSVRLEEREIEII